MVKIIILNVMILFLISGCYIDVIHNSSNDPANPFGTGNISVQVSDKNGFPIDSCVVIINDSSLICDENGSINDYSIISDSINITIMMEGFRQWEKDTVINTGEDIDLNIVLNKIPVICNSIVYSSVNYRYNLLDTLEYAVHIETSIDDEDGIDDIDSCYVCIFNEELSLHFDGIIDGLMKFTLILSEDTRAFNIFDLQGAPMCIKIVDKSYERDSSETLQLVRFINYMPENLNPVNFQTILFPDSLEWRVGLPPYEAYLNALIYSPDSNIALCDTIDINTYVYYIDSMFNSGQYILDLRVYDAYSNYSSKSINFNVQ